MRKFTKELTSYEDLCADGTFRRCDQNQVNMYVKQRLFFHTRLENQHSLGGYIEEHAMEVWERNCMNPEMQTALLNTYPPKLTATILKALREQLMTS